MRFLVLVALFACICLPSLTSADETQPVILPHEVVKQVSDALLVAIDGRRDELEANPERLHAIVDTEMRPRFDLRYAGRLVLARHWADATDKQRADFVEAQYGALVRRYSAGLLKHTETRVRVTPLRLQLADLEKEEFVTVRTTVILDDGKEIPVNYEMRRADHDWRVYDVKIEGRSYVSHYREIIRDKVGEKGLDGVIEELNSP